MTRRIEPLFSLFQLGLSIQHWNKKSEQRLGLSLGQWCLLRHLVDLPAVSAQGLAKEVGVHPSTLTQSLKRLESRGFIFVAEDPKDSRKKRISITRQGREALLSAHAVMDAQAKSLADMEPALARLKKHLADQISTI